MRQRPLLSLLAWLGLASCAAAQSSSPLPAPLLRALQDSGVPLSAVSLLVMPAEGGAPGLTHQADVSRQAASVMKLFTTGTALRTLGPAYAWSTDAGLAGSLSPRGVLKGSVHVRGNGDPSLVLEQVQLMLSRWRAAGLRDIQGDIVVDRQVFDVPVHDPAAFDGQSLKPYNAGPDGLLLNHQAISLRLGPDAARPGQVRVSMEPELDGVELDARLVSLSPQKQASCGDWREALALKMTPVPGWHRLGRQRWRIQLRGPYPQACGDKIWPVLWQGDGPGDYSARLLTTTWLNLGGKLGGQVSEGAWPADLPVWQRWTSAPLGQVVRDINKFSNNVMARQLFLTLPLLDAPTDRPPSRSTLAQAQSLVQTHVRSATQDASGHSPCDGEALILDNGSGLSRTERSSALCLGRWLQTLWRSPVMPEMLASMPITGQDGTTRRWQSVAGRAHIKTGSLDGVAAMAGYVETDSGHRQVVVALINHPQADATRPLMEALVAWAQHDH